ncbi:hypothetical protein I4U23_008407 [Adineta vaga]|nr:hypothetical protein I4U23_008407 [Adineta vaga]
MKNISVIILFLTIVLIQTIISFEVVRNELQSEPLSFSSTSERNDPECISKKLLSNFINRNRRASISRPYFQHWRGSRDEDRYGSKSFWAYSPRLGKRAYNNNYDQQMKPADLQTLLAFLNDNLLEQPIDIVYADSTTICFSRSINDAFIREILENFSY